MSLTAPQKRELRVLHVGLGVRGRHWLEIVADRKDITSVGCVDPQSAALDWVKSRFPRLSDSCFGSLEQALAEVEADAAIIATPPPFHGEDSLKGLQARLAVMVEKPFAPNLGDALRVVEQSRTLHIPVLVAQNYRFSAAERTLRHFIREGRIGRPVSATCIARRRRPGAGTFLGTMEFPQMADVAVHHFDSLRSILGVDGAALLCQVSNPSSSDYRHGAVTEALIEMQQGITVQYLGTLTSLRDEYSLWVEGDRGALWTDRKWVWWRRRGQRFFLPARKIKVPKGDELPYPREGTTSLLDGLRDAIFEEVEPETSALDNLQTLAMVEAGKRSATEHRRVTIQETLGQRVWPAVHAA